MIPNHTHTEADTHRLGGAQRMRGKDRSARPWRRLRARVLVRDKYTCQMVKADGSRCGRVDERNEVDHIKPLHMGGTNVATNLQTICAQCHKLKTAIESGQHGQASMTPAWMPTWQGSDGGLQVVCGRPGADLEGTARLMAKGPDMIISLDRMATDAGMPTHAMTGPQLGALIRHRNDLIAAHIKNNPLYKLFVVATCPNPAQREYWASRRAQVHVVDTPLEVCQRRIVNMGLPPAVTEKMMQAAQDWS